jgi:hypothetical protein
MLRNTVSATVPFAGLTEHGNANCVGNQPHAGVPAVWPQPPGRVAARPGEAVDKTKLDRVITNAEDDRDRPCRSFGRKRGPAAGGRGDHGHPTADEVSRQFRQGIEFALQPVVFDHHILAFDVAGFAKPFAELGHIARGGIGRPAVEKPDHRQRLLLRPRHERPRRRAKSPSR